MSVKNITPKNITLSSNQLIVLTCSYLVLGLNLPFLLKSAQVITTLEDYSLFFLLSLPLFLFSLSVIIQGVFVIRWLTKPILMITVVLSALLCYATLNYGIIFDVGMIQNTIETDSAEVLSYLNIPAILFVTLFGLLPAFLIYKVKIRLRPIRFELFNRFKLITANLGIVFFIASLFYSNYAAVGRNHRELVSYITPYKMIDSSYKFIRDNYFYSPLPFKVLDPHPHINRNSNKKHVTVMVLGETARAQNFSLNGYPRPTNQFTQNFNVISFNDVRSCGTATAVSVPCMFSRLDKKHYEKRVALAQQNAIDLISQAGADVLWISNNNGSCKGVCNRVDSIKISTDTSNPLCDGEYCYDEALLAPLANKLNNLTKDDTLIVLHMIGSHGPTYYRRYPQSQRLFTPDCQRSDIQNCTNEQLVNTYDNTIAYTDFVLAKIINQLTALAQNSDIDTSFLYISDHGESLGEKGVYLHGLPYAFSPEEQTHVPMIYWADQYHTSVDLNCVNKSAPKHLTQDIIFDSLLSLMSVKSSAHHLGAEPFMQCMSQETLARANSVHHQDNKRVN
ncbi:phosphoethanolamine transferase [Colwellia sp. MEBiC06753]